ncbi:hypothetical protein GC173_13755 [bacterium]|nr:hypothetical protein [bacterium]
MPATIPRTESGQALLGRLASGLPGIRVIATPVFDSGSLTAVPELQVIYGGEDGTGSRTWIAIYIDSNLSNPQDAYAALIQLIDDVCTVLEGSPFRVRQVLPPDARRACEFRIVERLQGTLNPPFQLHRGISSVGGWGPHDWPAGSRSIDSLDIGELPAGEPRAAVIQGSTLLYLGGAHPHEGGISVEYPIRNGWSGGGDMLVFQDSGPLLVPDECREIRDNSTWRTLTVGLSGTRHFHTRRRESWRLDITSMIPAAEADLHRARMAEDSTRASLLLTTPQQEVLEASILGWELESAWGMATVRLSLQVTPLLDHSIFLEDL